MWAVADGGHYSVLNTTVLLNAFVAISVVHKMIVKNDEVIPIIRPQEVFLIQHGIDFFRVVMDARFFIPYEIGYFYRIEMTLP